MTASEEEYVHYVECIDSLNRAWRILQELRAIEPKSGLHAMAFSFALIEYAKPYCRSDGTLKKGKNAYKLPPPDLPAEYLNLHQQILDLRDQVLAHSDLTLKEAKVYIPPYPGRPTVASNRPPSLPDGEAVVALIERTLEKMYLERERLIKALSTRQGRR